MEVEVIRQDHNLFVPVSSVYEEKEYDGERFEIVWDAFSGTYVPSGRMFVNDTGTLVEWTSNQTPDRVITRLVSLKSCSSLSRVQIDEQLANAVFWYCGDEVTLTGRYSKSGGSTCVEYNTIEMVRGDRPKFMGFEIPFTKYPRIEKVVTKWENKRYMKVIDSCDELLKQ